MRDIEELKLLIEKARRELDEALLAGECQENYQKSLYLDRLIEEYLDAKEKGESVLRGAGDRK